LVCPSGRRGSERQAIVAGLSKQLTRGDKALIIADGAIGRHSDIGGHDPAVRPRVRPYWP